MIHKTLRQTKNPSSSPVRPGSTIFPMSPAKL